jgi:large subunit ribosomal protein L33
MAKKKGARETVGLVCKNCKSQNYATTRNKINIEGKLIVRKFCNKCKKQTEHKEISKLK